MNDKERYGEILEEQWRRAAYRDVLAYAQYVNPNYRVNWHHREIGDLLMRMEAGLEDRGMVVLPPRHGKSLLCSVIFPAWYFGRNPSNEVIAWSYGGDLAHGFGARLRNLMSGERHRAVFGEDGALSIDTRARDRFMTNAGGVYRSAGSQGGITGFGAHLFIIDDPVKGFEEANSAIVQKKASSPPPAHVAGRIAFRDVTAQPSLLGRSAIHCSISPFGHATAPRGPEPMRSGRGKCPAPMRA